MATLKELQEALANAQIKINQGASALQKTATQNAANQSERSLIDRLVEAGILGGANLPNQ